MVKGDRGVIGITENETALRRWMVAGPETARLLTEYEEKHSRKKKESERHHEQIPSVLNQESGIRNNLLSPMASNIK